MRKPKTLAQLKKDLTNKVWMDIPGYVGLYQASSLGEIRSLPRMVWSPANKSYSSINGRNLKLDSKDKKYQQVRLCKNGCAINWLVHRLIAITFIPNPANWPEVNHIDSNSFNNNVENLEWITRKANMEHAKKYGGRGPGMARVWAKKSSTYLGDDVIREIRNSNERGIELSRKYNVSQGTISMIRSNKIWTNV